MKRYIVTAAVVFSSSLLIFTSQAMAEKPDFVEQQQAEHKAEHEAKKVENKVKKKLKVNEEKPEVNKDTQEKDPAK